jgi:hypothetical protein
MYPAIDREFLSLGYPPAILHVCSESRAVGLSKYSLSFGTENHPAKIYFNPVSDIIYFGSRQFVDELVLMFEYFRKYATSLNFADQIQNIALTERLWKHKDSPIIFKRTFSGSRGTKGIGRFLMSFPSLEELIFVKGVDSYTEDRMEDYAGILLVKSSTGPETERLDGLALDAVLSTFSGEEEDHPEWKFPEISIMEFGTRDD